MAINQQGAGFLLWARRHGAGAGRVLVLGRQHLELTSPEARRLEKLHEVSLLDVADDSGGEHYAEPFLEKLGARQVDSLDVSDYQGCSVVQDLNEPLKPELRGQFDLVFDGGSLEHIFNFPAALTNSLDLVAPGGLFANYSPANNFLGHGFYQFSPELFFRVLCPERGFELISLFLAEWGPQGRLFSVTDPSRTGRRTQAPSGRPLNLMVLARRTGESSAGNLPSPQQSDYSRRWADNAGGGESGGGVGTEGGGGWKGMIPVAWKHAWWNWLRARRQASKRGSGIQELPRFW